MERLRLAALLPLLAIALYGCLQQPVQTASAPSAVSTPTPVPVPTTPTEWTGEVSIIYWVKAPFKVLPSPAAAAAPSPTPIPTPVPKTVFGQKCLADPDCPPGYFCNSFNRTYFKYGEDGNASSVTESYGDGLCYVSCGSDGDCAKGEHCGSIPRFRGNYEGRMRVCARK